MRTLPLAAVALVLLAAPAAAQMPAATYVFTQATGPTEAVAPGSMVAFTFIAERSCAFAGDVLPETVAKVAFHSDSNLTVAGPGQVQFPQQVCASEPRATVDFQATVVVPKDAEARIHQFKALLHPEPNGPLPRFGGEATIDFLLAVQEPEAPVVTPEGDAEAPGASLLALVVLVALAALSRRR